MNPTSSSADRSAPATRCDRPRRARLGASAWRPSTWAGRIALSAATAAVAGSLLAAAPTPDRAGAQAPTPQPGACAFTVDKTAAPATVLLGEEVTVTLRIGGGCAPQDVKSDVVLAIDRSSSMLTGNKLNAARAAAKQFLDEIDSSLVHVGLVAFDDVAESLAYLTDDKAALRTAIDGMTSNTGTNLVQGLDEARKMLVSAGARADARKVIIFLTDGRHHSNNPPLSELPRVIAEVRAAGIVVYAIGLGADVDEATLQQMAGDPSKYLRSPTAGELSQIFVQLAGQIKAERLMEEAFIVDQLPADMTYVPNSGSPAPSVSPDGRTLTWRLYTVPLPPPDVILTYRVRPTQTGLRPTNVEARVDLTDGFRRHQTHVFPVPKVTVLAPPTAVPTPLPPPTAMPPPVVASCVCRVTRNKVPPEVIDAALADPSKVYGWQYPLNPNLPPGLPANPPRTCLDLQNRGLQYHPLFNSVVWRAGCLIGPP